MRIGHKLSEETKRKISIANRGRKQSEETIMKRKLSIAKLGYSHSKETRKKISIARMGMKFSEEHKRNISEAQKGMKRKPCSEKTKKKIGRANSIILKGRKLPKERCEQIRQRLIGHITTNETRKKIAEKMKGRKYTLERRGNISRALRGKYRGHPSGINTISPVCELIRGSYRYIEWRTKIFVRDNFTCQKCMQTGGNLRAHHKKYFSKLLKEAKYNLPLLTLYEAAMNYPPLWDIKNGITLCGKCHNKLPRR